MHRPFNHVAELEGRAQRSIPTMPTFDARAVLPDDQPGPWGEPVPIRYDRRDVLLYAVGIGTQHLGFVFEGDPQFAVFPTFPIRWGGAGAPVDTNAIPHSPGPLNIDAERYLESLLPMPVEGEVTVRSRIIGVHPRGKGSGFVEYESIVSDADGNVCARMVNGSFRRGIEQLGDIEPFEDAGQTFSAKLAVPQRSPDVTVEAHIASNQGHIYRLSGDYNPLHIDPAAARFGGFDRPILHGLCTFGHCGQLLLGALCDNDPARFRKIKVRFSSPVFMGDLLQVRAWRDGEGRVVFEAAVEDKVVVSNAYFEYE
jgi:acyl dehydratase